MKEFLRLIRWQNLVMVILTMVLMRYAILQPILGRIEVTLYSIAGSATTMMLQLPWYDFVALVAATVMITAAGYVINDYFDIRTDLINKGRVIVGEKIPRRRAMMIHNILNAGGVAVGFYVSWKAGYMLMGILFLLVSGLLYFYSASYKRQFLIGNFIVAFLTAMVPMLVIIYEAPMILKYYTINASDTPKLGILFSWAGGFALFAFLSTLAREIIKDIEDFEGDVAFGRNTLPVVLGILTSKIIVISLIIAIITLLYIVWYLYVNDMITVIYISVAIVLPLVFVIIQMTISKTRRNLHLASRLMKIVMLTGILYSVVVKILLTYNLV